MTYEEFLAACETDAELDISPALRALRLDRRNDWEGAHHATQEGDTIEGAWVHAYLHRKEGDVSNARYWYNRASRPESRESLDQEWESIARALLV
jgi:hypothetical protein